MNRKDYTERMYADVKTWNPFKGCLFDCLYCKPSFQLQAKRQKQNCMDCYNYIPHEHPERLDRIPGSATIFTCGNGDIAFCDPTYTRQIIEAVKVNNGRDPKKTYYFQSKRPAYFEQFLGELPANVILLTTLETNRDDGYGKVSKAPVPTERFRQFLALDYPRKVITIEPLMDFDAETFLSWVKAVAPEYVWIGFNSRPKQVRLPEPSRAKASEFLDMLRADGAKVRGKDLRGL
jgi:hypothetical protein